MMRLSGSGGKNPLVQRMQQYTDMSAIFRSPELQETTQAIESRTDYPVANTFVIPPHATTMPDTHQDDIEAFIASQPPTPEVKTAPASPPQLSKETATSTMLSASVSAQTPVAPPPSQRTEQPPSASKEGGLSRLKSVMKQVQRAISGDPPTIQEDSSDISGESAELADTTTAVTPQPTTPATIQREPETPPTQAPLELLPIPEDAPAAVQTESADTTAAPLTAANPQTPEDALSSNRLDQIMHKPGTIEPLPTEEPAAAETAVPTDQPTEGKTSQPTTPPATVQREPVESQSAPPSSTQPLASDERDSRRLDKIMNKHREAGTIEPQEGLESQAPETDTSTTLSASVPDLPADSPTKQPAIQREPETTSPQKTAQPLTPEERDSHRLDTIMRKHRKAGNIEPPVIDEAGNVIQSDIPFQPVVQKKENQSPPLALDNTPVSASEDLTFDHQEADSAPAIQADIPTQIQRHPAPKTEPTPTHDMAKRDDGRETAVSPEPPPHTTPPLQSAWPVQMVDPPAPTPISPPPPVAPSADTIMREVTPEEDTKVREQLNNIPPDQETDSSVQFIRPRKPRPTPPPTKTQTIQREKTADSSPSEPPKTNAGEESVATEIGELPSDLWRLIGDKPPPISQQPEPTPQPHSPAFSPGNETNDAQAKPLQMIDPETVQPTLIQRTEDTQAPGEDRATEDIAPPSEAPPAPESEQTRTEPGEEEINMDDLARQVYGEIKERMSIEWERTRGRF